MEVYIVLYGLKANVDDPCNNYYGVYATKEAAEAGIASALDVTRGPDLSMYRFRIIKDYAHG